jgi:hypothetical protein
MIAIEKLDRYYIPFVGKMPDGYYVSEEAYRAREDALLNALKELSGACWHNKVGGGVEANIPSMRILAKAIEIADEIEATR